MVHGTGPEQGGAARSADAVCAARAARRSVRMAIGRTQAHAQLSATRLRLGARHFVAIGGVKTDGRLYDYQGGVTQLTR